MGKRKKVQNVVKIELGEDGFERGGVTSVLVQHVSKDGRRMAQTVHNVPTPRAIPPDPNPPFDPTPVYGITQDSTSAKLCDPMGEPDGPERVCPHFVF